jgi:hypothetical protein
VICTYKERRKNKPNSQPRREGQAHRGEGRSCDIASMSHLGKQTQSTRAGGAGEAVAGAYCAKQTQLPGEARWDGVPGAGDGGQMRQTNPISSGAKRRAKAWRRRSYGEWNIR